MRIRGQRIQQAVARLERKLPPEKHNEKHKLGKLVEKQKQRLEIARAIKHWEQVNDSWESQS